MSPDLGEKDQVRRDTHQSDYSVASDGLLHMISSEKPGGMISSYIASIGQKTPFLLVSNLVQ